MANPRSEQARKLSSILSGAMYDIPVWARGLMVIAGLAGVVLAVVASLEGGKDQTIPVDKLLHFSGYATLAFIFVLGLRPALYFPALVLLALMGLAIEYYQPFNTRTRDPNDEFANLLGLVAGAVAGLTLRIVLRVVRTQMKLLRLRRRRRTYSSGAVIVRQGALVDRFCLIEHGEVQICREADGRRHILGTMGPGEVFGLLEVLQSKPQYGTAESLRDTSLFSIELNDLIETTGGQWEPVASVLTVMAKHLRTLADRVVELEKAAS
jgi:VanZ family protein